MVVPDEVALYADDLELIIVELGDDPRTPLLADHRQLLGKIDGLVRLGLRSVH
jgi:hypothetical protein